MNYRKVAERSYRMQLSRTTILLVSVAVVTMTSIGLSTFSLFLLPIETEFGWSRTMATVPYMVSMIGWAVGAVLFGKLADDFGTRGVILAGIVLMSAGFLGMGLSQNLWQLLLSYGVMVGLAMGACGLAIVSLLVSKHFEAEDRGFAVSMIQTAPPLSALIVPPVFFFLMQTYDWRMAAFVGSALLALVALPLAWFGARDPKPSGNDKDARVRWGACLPYLRNRSMIFLFAARFSCGVAFFQIAHLVALTMSKGFDAAAGAKAVSVFGAAAIASALLFGWLSDRYGRARMLALSYFVRGIGTLLLALNFPNELFFYAAVAVAIGPTFGTVAIQNVMFYEMVGPRMAGVVLGLSFIVHQIGSASGPMIASIAFDQTGSYDGFMVAMAVILVASGLLVYNITGPDAHARGRGRLLAASPSAP
jgi:MFS family permease